MPSDRYSLIAKKACTRCSTQKRRCDRALPDCGLCKRLRRQCKYEISQVGSPGLTPSPSPKPTVSFRSGLFALDHLKEAIIQELATITPEDVFLSYCQAIEPWFPVVSVSRLRSRLPPTWDEAPLDFALLCLCILLITATPPSSPEDSNNNSEFKSMYLYIKSNLASIEGLGVNSFLTVQSRILVTLFEVGHGFYPAAYISIGAIIRAADALEIRPWVDASPSASQNEEEQREETTLIWCGILILDRYIAIESGPQPPITSSRSLSIQEFLKPALCPTHDPNQNRTSSICRLSRLVEASSLLEKIHATLNSSPLEHELNVEELILTVQTLVILQGILNLEVGEGIYLYAGGLNLCNIALLLAFEHGSKVPPLTSGPTANCTSIADTSLNSILSTVTSVVELFMMDTRPIDFNLIPPFVTFLVFKAAAIVTQKLLLDNDSSEDLKILRILRKFLGAVGKRWLSCDRYLKLLNDDTTPRLLKVLEQR
ncbi:hypothetical protein LHYA1_G007573 [Lachnellula hyalina]|uniref:Zn(2)-C6 fungal-type domain-containing protein n=1 Tax=Lachnellula hyalina TaxID=1316788 RepID=A0A8H8QWH8_9HELO|nr:uncharacterized protein LHYA1_G007573 [Lachnellula hyalina]TVY23821.1 hypothetical protein LHYA1_G007573 [Lachnellula hyalina]